MVTGTGTVRTTPDQASITIGVETQAGTTDEALSENSARMTRVVEALQELGIPDTSIKTSYFSISPIYNYTKGYAEIVGYSAVNTVEVTTTMLDKLGTIIDGTVAVGANQIGSVYFSLTEEKEKELRDRAIAAAAADATSKAGKLAESMNVKLVGIKEMSIGGGGVSFIVRSDVAPVPSPPILPGDETITSTVQVTYLIG
jgi:uncharacterized protein YggE